MNVKTIIEKIKKYNPRCNEARIRKAFEFADRAHKGQIRKSGEPFIIHPLCVANDLADYGADEDTIIASLLHDVPEDTSFDLNQIQKLFGKNVAFLVNGVTKIRKELTKMANARRKMEILRKFICSVAKDQRVLLIKLLDRRHNMRTIHHLPPEKQIKKARETLYYYVPLAKSISLWDIKSDLENMSFRILKPQMYARYEKLIRELSLAHKKNLNNIRKEIIKAFGPLKIPARVEISLLTPYEIHELKMKKMDAAKHFFRIMIITDTRENCYASLGIVHSLYKPVLKYFDDYIAIPKENRYQALHTTVIHRKGQMCMIQIQTDEMHKFSRISAPFDTVATDNLKNSLCNLDESVSSESYLKKLKEEVFSRQVLFFDYRGNSYKLPQGASVLDFFYQTRNPNIPPSHVYAAMVNDKKTPLKKLIQTDDIIEFLTGNGHTYASPLMLRYAKTSLAQRKIKNELASLTIKEAIREGEKLLKDELWRLGMPEMGKFGDRIMRAVVKKLKLCGADELFEKTGRGQMEAGKVAFAFYLQNKKRLLLPDTKQHNIAMRILNDKNRVGFVKDILDTFQKHNINIQEIKGYSPRRGKLGIVDLKLYEQISESVLEKKILPLLNALEQVDSVSSVILDFFVDNAK